MGLEADQEFQMDFKTFIVPFSRSKLQQLNGKTCDCVASDINCIFGKEIYWGLYVLV